MMKNGDAVVFSARGMRIKHNIENLGPEALGIATSVHFDAVRVRWVRRIKSYPFGTQEYTDSEITLWHRRDDIKIARSAVA